MRPVLVALLVLAPLAAAQPAPGDLVINEVMYDPPTPQPSGNEWVEVLNVSGRALDVSGLAVSDGTATSAPLPAGSTLGDGAFLVLVDDGAAFAAAYPGVPFVELAGFPTLNNSGDRPALVIGGMEIDAVPYRPSWGGTDASLERRDPFGPSTVAANFGTSTAASGATPGAQNSIFETDTDPPALVSAEAIDATTVVVRFDEPVTPETAEIPSNYQISDGVGAPMTADLQDDGTTVVLGLATALSGRRTFTLTVSGVADARGNVVGSAQTTFFFGQGEPAEARDLVVNEFLYDEPTSDNPGEFVELFNRTDKAFDLREFTLNDGVGSDQPVTDQPAFVEPGGYAVIVEDAAAFAAVFPGVAFVEQPSWSALNNSGDDVILKYRGTTIDSLRYTPAWGGEDASLERKDPDGPSSSASNWTTTSDPRGGTPGEQNSQFAPDLEGPTLVAAQASADGLRVVVTLDEPARPSSVTASAFTVGGAAVASASYDGETTVTLTLQTPLSGPATVTASGLVDALGNTTAETSAAVAFVADEAAPRVVRATALSANTVRVTLSEGVTAATGAAPGTYALDDGVGAATAVEVVESVGDVGGPDGVRVVDVTFGQPLQERTLYTLTATGLRDLAGNVTPTSTARVFFGTADTPAPGDIAITEVMYDPQNGAAGEYVELLNRTADQIFDLRALTVDDGDGDGDPLSREPAVLLPGEHLAVVRDADGFRQSFPEAPSVEAGSVIGLSNSGEAVVVRASGVAIDSVFYDPAWHRVELDDATGIALERRDPAGPSNAASNWSSSLAEAGGTPSAPNSVSAGGAPVERDAGLTVAPSPFAPIRGQAAAITVTLGTEGGLVRARIYDGGGRLVRELERGRLVGGEATLVWDGTGDDGRPLRAGIYVVLAESVDAQAGTTEAVRGVVVLARPE